jgi:hypothetical protein
MARGKKSRRRDWRTTLLVVFSVIIALLMILAIVLPSIPLGPS